MTAKGPTDGTGNRARRWLVWEKPIRAFVHLAFSILALVNEFFIRPQPRVIVLVFVASMMGIPFVWDADRRGRSK